MLLPTSLAHTFTLDTLTSATLQPPPFASPPPFPAALLDAPISTTDGNGLPKAHAEDRPAAGGDDVATGDGARVGSADSDNGAADEEDNPSATTVQSTPGARYWR